MFKVYFYKISKFESDVLLFSKVVILMVYLFILISVWFARYGEFRV